MAKVDMCSNPGCDNFTNSYVCKYCYARILQGLEKLPGFKKYLRDSEVHLDQLNQISAEYF